MVCRGMLPGPRKRLLHGARCWGHRSAPPGDHASDGRQFQHQPSGTIWKHKGKVYLSCGSNGGIGGNVRTLPPVTHPMGSGMMDLEHVNTGPGGVVLDGLHPWERFPSVP